LFLNYNQKYYCASLLNKLLMKLLFVLGELGHAAVCYVNKHEEKCSLTPAAVLYTTLTVIICS